jgi:hypothetical protein
MSSIVLGNSTMPCVGLNVGKIMGFIIGTRITIGLIFFSIADPASHHRINTCLPPERLVVPVRCLEDSRRGTGVVIVSEI